MNRILATLLLASISIVSLAGCEDPRTYRPVTDAELRTYSLNTGDSYVELALLLETDQLALPEINIPVTDVRRGNIDLANLVLRPSAQPGMSEMLLAVNVSRMAGLEGAKPVLPNGSVLPVGGVDMRQLVALPIEQFNKNGRIYLAIDTVHKTAIMGAALTWGQLDPYGARVGALNFFPSFNFANGVRGIAGVFASNVPNQSGVAVFADISSVLKQPRRRSPVPTTTSSVLFLE